MKRFEIHVIPHEEQRYNTIGDWVMGEPHQLYVSDLGNPDAEFLVILHEMVELWLCHKAGIPQTPVDAWDLTWEPSWDNQHDPGCDRKAPYHEAHEAGEVIERVMCPYLMDWHEYERALEALNPRNEAEPNGS